MKRVLQFLTLILLSLVLVSCSKTANHSTKDIETISIFDRDDNLLKTIDPSLHKDFINELNSLVYVNYSTDYKTKKMHYIIIDYKNMDIKVNIINTVRVDLGTETRNRNRSYDKTEFYNLIDKYLAL